MASRPEQNVLTPEEIQRRKSSVANIEIQGPGGEVRVVALEELSEADKALAAEFGYKPVFKREFGYFAAFSFAVSISGTFSTIATTLIYPLEAGGSASAVWCWLISGAGCMCIAVSLPTTLSKYSSGAFTYPPSSVRLQNSCPRIPLVEDCKLSACILENDANSLYL